VQRDAHFIRQQMYPAELQSEILFLTTP